MLQTYICHEILKTPHCKLLTEFVPGIS